MVKLRSDNSSQTQVFYSVFDITYHELFRCINSMITLQCTKSEYNLKPLLNKNKKIAKEYAVYLFV